MAYIPYKPDLSTDRGRHLHWCKQRAIECINRGELEQAWASFASDMEKHESTRGRLGNDYLLLAMMYMNSPTQLQRFIEGFN